MKGSRRIAPPSQAGLLDYVESSGRAAGAIQLDRLNTMANIRDRIAGEIEEWVKARAEMLFASWVIERRQAKENSGFRTPNSGAAKGCAHDAAGGSPDRA